VKLTHTATALVEAKLDRRTETDHRIRLLTSTTPMLRVVLKRFGFSVTHADDGKLYATDLVCGNTDCGAVWHDRENHPAMYYDSRGANYPGNPEHIVCTVCGYSRETASTLFKRLCTKNVSKTLDLWPVTRLPVIDFTVVRCAGKVAIGESFRATAEQVAPKRIDLDRDVQATLIRASSLPVASEAMKHADFPEAALVTVPVTHELWPKQRWHAQPMSETDAAPIRRYQRQRVAEAEAAVEAEVQQFRDEISARQRA
jgi:hypothetical protein